MTTHGHPDAQAAAVAVAEAVAVVLPWDPVRLAEWNGAAFLQHLIEILPEQSYTFIEFAHCLELAKTLLVDDIDTETAVRVLGVSAWARESVPAALYLVARCPHNLERLLWSAVNLTGGAVESIATIVGAIGGALHGVTALPARWRRGVEDTPRLLEAALGLHRIGGA